MAASVYFQPLSDVINDILSKDIFPEDAKIATFSPLNRDTF